MTCKHRMTSIFDNMAYDHGVVTSQVYCLKGCGHKRAINHGGFFGAVTRHIVGNRELRLAAYRRKTAKIGVDTLPTSP